LEIITLSIMILVILSIVLAPFIMKPSNDEAFADESERGQQKEQVFAQLSDLEYDYHMKKITDQDYASIKAELTEKAANLFNPQDINEIEHEVDEEIKQYLAGTSIQRGGSSI
jgi:hypothetical protein